MFRQPSDLSAVSENEKHDAASDLESNGTSRTYTNATGRSFSWKIEDPRKQHSLRIVLACGLVILPMLAFTIALVYIVFTNLLDHTPCPYPDLCPGPELLNTTSGSYYYVDFSATRLAFLASLSSSISFSLVSILMSIYAYSIARDLLYSSMSTDREKLLPSPYQMSVLIRLLNADLLMLWELFTRKIEEIFWKKERSEEAGKGGGGDKKFPHLLRASVLFFLFIIFASIYIQAADSYLHISTDAVNMVEVHVEPSATHYYSRGLSQWCIDRPSLGAMDNKNFFSCSLIRENVEGVGNITSLSNSTLIFAADNGVSKDNDILSFEHEDGDSYAVVAPANMDPSIDWKASSFGVSTKCSAIPPGACDIRNTTVDDLGQMFRPITCHQNQSGLEINGNITQSTTQHAYIDFHKYLREGAAFSSRSFVGFNDTVSDLVPITTEADANDIFRNPWHWAQVLKYADDVEHSSEQYMKDPTIQRLAGLQDFVLLSCNTTVWDVNYSVVGGKVTELSRTKSNGSIAGISSMASTHAPNFMAPSMAKAYFTANSVQTSPSNFVSSWKAAVSRALALPLAAQSSPRQSELVQRRVAKVVTRLPKAALWILVSSNLTFAIIGLGLAAAALTRKSMDAHQVHTRLGVAGLAAALFETQHSHRVAREDSKLFEENVERKNGSISKKVGVRLTGEGGASFVLNQFRGR